MRELTEEIVVLGQLPLALVHLSERYWYLIADQPGTKGLLALVCLTLLQDSCLLLLNKGTTQRPYGLPSRGSVVGCLRNPLELRGVRRYRVDPVS